MRTGSVLLGPTLAASLACSAMEYERRAPIERPAYVPTPAEEAKHAWLARIAAAAPDSPSPFLGLGLLPRLEELMTESDAHTKIENVGIRWAHAMRLMRRGDLDAAIASFEATVDDVIDDESIDPYVKVSSLYTLALANFRLAERQNCIAHHNSESCILPLRGAGEHIDRIGAERALTALQEALALGPHELVPEVRWLLNVAHMALGTWPDAVPPADLLPPERLASEASFARFTDVAPEHGMMRFTRAGSVVMDDFDGDHRLDLLVSSFDPATRLELWTNDGRGGFRNETEPRGLAGQLGGLNLVQADVDGDGRLDVLVLRGGHLGEEGEMPCSLLVQDEHGLFRDRTAAAGIEVAAPTRTAAFADVDDDGDLDLFVGYETIVTDGVVRYPSRLWLNAGDGTFRDGTEASRIAPEPCRGAAFADVDADGRVDLYLSIQSGPNRLYLGDGRGGFDLSPANDAVAAPDESSAVAFADFDQDGDVDLFVGFHADFLGDYSVTRWWLEDEIVLDTPRLYANDGRGGFTDVTAAWGLERTIFVQGAAAGDLDDDGFPDLYLATGGDEMSALWPNLAFRNDGTRLLDVTDAGGFGHLQKGQGLAIGDVDGDGDRDVFVQTGGYHLDDGFGDVLFQNPGNEHRSLTVVLVGRHSNRSGLGARVRVVVEDESGEPRTLTSFVWPTGSFGSGPLRRELGLGDAVRIRSLEVRWPRDGHVVSYDPPEPGDVVVAHEDGSQELIEL